MSKDYGIKISKAGYDVRVTGNDNLVLTSQYESFKSDPVKSGSITVSIAKKTIKDAVGVSATQTIWHGFGYVPFFLVGVKFGTIAQDGAPTAGLHMMPWYINYHSGAGVDNGNYGEILGANRTSIRVKYGHYIYYPGFDCTAGGYDVEFQWMIFKNNVELDMLGPFINRTYDCMGYGG